MIVIKKKPCTKKWACGASAVEFALIAPFFFFLLFAIIEISILFWVNLTMQYAVREGARYSVTGQTNLDPNSQSQQHYRAVIQKITDSSMGLYEKVSPIISVNGTSYGGPGQYSATMFGMAGEIVELKLDCAWPIMTPIIQAFFPDGKYRFSVATTMRNEAF